MNAIGSARARNFPLLFSFKKQFDYFGMAPWRSGVCSLASVKMEEPHRSVLEGLYTCWLAFDLGPLDEAPCA